MGTTAGVVILVMSLTGVLLAYEHQIIDWADGYHVGAPAAGTPHVSLDVLLVNARAVKPDVSPSMVMLSADPSKPASVRLGRERTVYLDPYTGQVLGTGSARAHAFFEFIEGWHRWLGASAAKYRTLGRGVTDVCNLVFLFIVVTGAFLWWPRQWNVRAIKRVALLDWRLAGKARDFNWHNAIGVWSLVPLFAIVLSGVFMSYQWPSSTLNRWSGVQQPTRAEGEGRVGEARSGGARNGKGRNAEGRSGEGRAGGPLFALTPGQLDTLWAHARVRAPAWKSASFRLPAARDHSVSFMVNRSTINRPDQRTTIEVDIATGQVKPANPAASAPGTRARMWARFIHTGEAFGIIGQTIAMLASLGAVFLVYTGITLTVRRNAAWLVRRARIRAAEPVPSAVVLG